MRRTGGPVEELIKLKTGQNKEITLPKRSSGTLQSRRIRQPWPKNRIFRILSIDGGGICGIFPAVFLAELEKRYLGNASVSKYFDLITGTSTGGIIALGLASGFSAKDLSEIYITRGREIFPPSKSGLVGMTKHCVKKLRNLLLYNYDREALIGILSEIFGQKKLGQSLNRLCIPSFDGRYGEVYIFKTPHHPDFHKDHRELITKVAAATAAAPTFFKPLEDRGYTFVDGGVWANNPVMVGLVDAMSCFDVPTENIRILSLGCGNHNHAVVNGWKISMGGLLVWRNIIYASMQLQSMNALGQAGLLIGQDKIIRIAPPETQRAIALDDWTRASKELPDLAKEAVENMGVRTAKIFLEETIAPYKALYT